jgi:hypothetical protein
MNKPYNIQNTNICNGIFHISLTPLIIIYFYYFYVLGFFCIQLINK